MEDLHATGIERCVRDHQSLVVGDIERGRTKDSTELGADLDELTDLIVPQRTVNTACARRSKMK